MHARPPPAAGAGHRAPPHRLGHPHPGWVLLLFWLAVAVTATALYVTGNAY